MTTGNVLTPTQILSEINTNMPDNSSGVVTPAIVRQVLADISVSYGSNNSTNTFLATNTFALGVTFSSAVTFGSNITVNGTVSGTGVATTAQWLADTASLVLTTDQVWGGGATVALVDASTVAVDFSTGVNFTVTLAGSRTLGNPSNMKVGQTGWIQITQGAGGSHTLGYSGNWKFAAGTAPTLSTSAGAIDMLFYTVMTSSTVLGSLIAAVA